MIDDAGFERIDLPAVTLWHGDDDHPTSPHSYWRHNEKTGAKGKRLTGVTTMVKVFDLDPSNLLRWAARTNGIGIAELYAQQGGGSWLGSAESIQSELEAYELTFDDVKGRASSRGTNVHEKVLEALARGEHPDFDGFTEEERGHGNAVIAWWLDHNPRPSLVEQILCDPDVGVAGRLDLLAEIDGRDGPGVIDLKTGYVSVAAHVQVAGYGDMIEASGFGDVPKWQAILKTSADGTYELIDGQATGADFAAAATVYRRVNAINAAVLKARQAVAA